MTVVSTLGDPAPSARLTAEDRIFIEEKLPAVVGWLKPEAAYLTVYIMNRQAEAGIHGPGLEFGVYHGKYLCLMLHQLLKRNLYAAGFDIFEECHPESAWQHAENLFGSRSNMILWKGSTADHSVRKVRKMLGAKASFISVDGDHSAEGALYDMKLAAGVMHPDAVVSVDDIYNTHAVGVSEGVFRYLFQFGAKLVPFAITGNKTFMCTRANHARYLAMARDFTTDHPDLEVVKRYVEFRANGENWVVQRLVGHDVLLLN